MHFFLTSYIYLWQPNSIVFHSLKMYCVRCYAVPCLGALTVLLDWQKGDMHSAHGMRPKPLTSVPTPWLPSLFLLSLWRQTLYIIFYFWLTHRWTDLGIGENGKGWWCERGKARDGFLYFRVASWKIEGKKRNNKEKKMTRKWRKELSQS